MSRHDNDKLLALLNRTVDAMEATSRAMREFGDELRAFRRDIEKLDRRVTKLEGKRRGK